MEALSTRSLSVRQRLAELSKIDPNACFSQDELERRREKIIRNSMILPTLPYLDEIKPFQNYGSLINEHKPMERPIFLLKTDFFRNIHPQTNEEKHSSIKEPSQMQEEAPSYEAIDVEEEIVGIKRAKHVQKNENQVKSATPTSLFKLIEVKTTEPQAIRKITEEPPAPQQPANSSIVLNLSQQSSSTFNNNLTTNIFNQPANTTPKLLFNLPTSNNSFFNAKSDNSVSPFNNPAPQANLFTLGSVEEKKPIIESATNSMSAFKVPDPKPIAHNIFAIGSAKPQEKIETKPSPPIFAEKKHDLSVETKQEVAQQSSLFQANKNPQSSEQSKEATDLKGGNLFQKANIFAAQTTPPPTPSNKSLFTAPSSLPSSGSPFGNSGFFGSKDNTKNTQQTPVNESIKSSPFASIGAFPKKDTTQQTPVNEPIKSSPFGSIGGFPKKDTEVQPPSPFSKKQTKVSNPLGEISLIAQNLNQTPSLSGFGQSNTLSTPFFGFASAPKTTPQTTSVPALFQNQSKSPFDKEPSKPLSFTNNSAPLFQTNSSLSQPSLFMNSAPVPSTNQPNSTPFNFGSKETPKPLNMQPLFGTIEKKTKQSPPRVQTAQNQEKITSPVISKTQSAKLTPNFKPAHQTTPAPQLKLEAPLKPPQPSLFQTPALNLKSLEQPAKPQKKAQASNASAPFSFFGTIQMNKQSNAFSKPTPTEEPSKKGFIFPSHTESSHSPKNQLNQTSLFGQPKQQSSNPIAIGPGGTKIQLISFQPKTESSSLFGSVNKSTPLFETGALNIFQQKLQTQKTGGLFSMGEPPKQGGLFTKLNMFDQQTIFSSGAPTTGFTGGNPFAQQGSSFLNANNPAVVDKGQGEDEQEEEDDGPIEAEDEANPLLSTGSYDYIQTQVFFKENANKYRLGSKQTIQNVIVSLERFTDKPDRYLYVRMSNKCIVFTGKILPKATEVRSINNSTKNIEIKKILLIDEKKPDKLQLVMLKLQFKDESTGGKLLKQLEKCLGVAESQ